MERDIRVEDLANDDPDEGDPEECPYCGTLVPHGESKAECDDCGVWLVWRSDGWQLVDEPYYTDAATATGMYDLYDG